ncbi:MAG: ATP-binding protein [Ginsengibacter sp.]
MKCLCHIYLQFILLLFTFQSRAQDTSFITSNVFVPENNEPVQFLQNYLWALQDEKGKLQIADLLQKKVSDTAFHKASTVSKPDPFSVWWCKITIEPSFSSKDFLIGVPFDAPSGMDNGNDIAEVWVAKNNQIINQYHTGNLNPVSVRPVGWPVNQNIFPITLRKGDAVSIYWRIQRTKNFSPPQFNFALQHKSIVTPSSYITAHKNLGYTALVYLGIMSILFFFGMVFFLITKQKTFIWFMLMAACLGLHIMLLHPANYLTQWFFPDHPVFQFHAFYWLIGLFNVSILMFVRIFVNTSKLIPLWDKVVSGMIIFIGCITLSASLFLEFNPRYQLPFFITLLAFISLLVIGLRLVLVKNLYAQWMGGAILWLFSFQLLGIFWNNQLLPDWVLNPWVIAQVGMMIIIFFALAYRFKQSAKDKSEAEKVLEMDKIKSRFFANISHEFRTPLTLIQGPLQQIEETVKGKEGSVDVPVRHIKTMRRNTDRLLELVNQLLDLSKLDSGKMKLQVVKGDMMQLLKVLTASFESMAERKGIHYHVHFPEQTQIVFFDKDKLEKIVSNLLTNAFKYTPEHGAVSVNVDIEDSRLRFSVEDNGPGIPKKELDKIFDRFYQVEGTEDKGSGIGLALVKELVDLYRGQISVSSEPGKGCRFKVSLPIDKILFKENELIYGEWQAEKTFLNRSIEKEETVIIKEAMQSQLPLLLIVEDNKDLRSFIKETVQQYYQVTEAGNGKEGLERAIAEVPDIIVSDVMMPEMDGFAMMQKLKKDERTSHIPVILLTAKAGQQHKLEGLETGADDYLTKPFDSKELLLRIQNLINQRKLLRKKFAGEILLRPSEIAVTSADEMFLNKVLQAIEKNMSEEDFGVEDLAKEVTMSRSQLHRKLIALTGQAPSEMLRNTRLLRAKELLQKRAATPSEVAYQVGFNSHTYFSKCFKEEFGISPSEVK